MSERCAGSLRIAQLLLQTPKNQVVRFRVIDLVSGPLCTRVYTQERHPRSQLGENVMRVLGDIWTGFWTDNVAGLRHRGCDVDIDELILIYASTRAVPGLRHGLWCIGRVG